MKTGQHRKSRGGCGECKLRKIKCDEGKPACRRCKRGGHLCRYGENNALGELVVNGAAKAVAFDVLSFLVKSPRPPELGLDAFSHKYLRLLNTFRRATALTVTTNRNRSLYQHEIIEIAYEQPMLMHTILALTLMHERFLNSHADSPPSYEECMHQWRSTAIFNDRISGTQWTPTVPEAVAIWVSGILISTLTFANVQSLDPERNWPFVSSSHSGVSWLIMSEGKDQLLPIIQVLRAEVAFQGLFPPQAATSQPRKPTQAELLLLPQCLLELCDLTTAADDSNPYYCAAATLTASAGMDFVSILMIFYSFARNSSARFKSLLLSKDPRALLMLSLWFARLHKIDIWWVKPRATVEGHAICMYLRRHFKDDTRLQQVMNISWKHIDSYLNQNPCYANQKGIGTSSMLESRGTSSGSI